MSNHLISKLTKTQILSLPGFQNKGSKTKKQLMDELKRNIARMKLKKRGLRVNDYINACQKADNDLFKNIAKTKRNQRARKASRKAYKQTIEKNLLQLY